jgi:2-(1,2-epoxy-1,2-dihydrophenyl)acetyl-CoA isomerase
MSEYHHLRVKQEQGVCTLLLSHPPANAFNLEMIDELIRALEWARQEPDIRCLILAGEGEFFSSGQDIDIIAELGQDIPYRDHLEKTYNRIVNLLRVTEKPMLCAINGPVAGAALGIVLATDIRWANDRAEFFFGFTRVGLSADSGTAYTLPLHVGWSRAMEMVFSNQPLSAAEALQTGMISKLLPVDQLIPQMKAYAHELAKGPAVAYAMTKRAFNHVALKQLQQVLQYEAYLQEIAGKTADHREGVQAFIEKRQACFEGV